MELGARRENHEEKLWGINLESSGVNKDPRKEGSYVVNSMKDKIFTEKG